MTMGLKERAIAAYEAAEAGRKAEQERKAEMERERLRPIEAAAHECFVGSLLPLLECESVKPVTESQRTSVTGTTLFRVQAEVDGIRLSQGVVVRDATLEAQPDGAVRTPITCRQCAETYQMEVDDLESLGWVLVKSLCGACAAYSGADPFGDD